MVEPSEIEWAGDGATFAFRGCRFVVDVRHPRERQKSDARSFTLVKSRDYIDRYMSELNFPATDIVEVGFFEGGSSVFLDRFYRPRRLVCIDRRGGPVVAVDAYRERFGRHEQLQMVHGVDQGDQEKVGAIVDEAFPTGIDLVIDDASHLYELTKATLGVLMPRLRPGGRYVIEDWGWAHGSRFQAPDHPWADEPALSNLVLELALSLASDSGMIGSMQLDRTMTIVTKHHEAPVSHEYWDVSASIVARGATISLI